MADYIIRGTAAHDFVRAFAVTSRDVTEEARKRHNLSPVAAAALGRTMAAALMMGADMKNDSDLLTLQFVCDGPIGGITVTSNAKGEVKGFVGNPSVMLPPKKDGHFDVGGAVGHGMLHVLKDIGLKEPYSGEVDIQTGEIAQDLTYYFAVSEQVPSVVALGVLMDRRDGSVAQAGGYIIQLMPDCPAPEDMLERILGGMDFRKMKQMPAAFHCNCSRERVTKALVAMGDKELRSLIDEGKPVTLNCHFCNTDYTFSVDELKTILVSAERYRS